MRSPWKRAAAPCLLASVCLLPLVGGCDNPTSIADKNLQKKVESDRAKGNLPADYEAAGKALAADVKLPGISDPARVDTQMRLARAEINQASALMRDAETREIHADRLAGEIRGLTGQIKTNNVIIAGFEGRKPDPTLKVIEDQKATISKGDTGGKWVAGDAGAIPALSSVTAKVDDLTKQIKDLTAKRASLEEMRSKASIEADNLDEQARMTKGQKALDLTIKAANLHAQARQAALDIEQTDITLARAQQDLKIAQARQAVENEALKSLDQTAAKLNEGWSQVQAQEKILTEQSERLLGKPGAATATTSSSGTAAPVPVAADMGGAQSAAPPAKQYSAAEVEQINAPNNITAKAEQIKALVADANTAREKAIELYKSALTHTNDAANDAAKVLTALKQSIDNRNNSEAPERAAWKNMADTLAPSRFNLQIAAIQADIARAYSTQAAGITVRDETRKLLAPVLESAKLQMPEAMKDFPPASAAEAASAAADKAFGESEDLLKKVIDAAQSPPDYMKSLTEAGKLAKVALINTLYNHAQFLERFGNTTKANALMGEAKGELREVDTERKETGEALPYFAPDLLAAVGLNKPTTQPIILPAATLPTTAPAAVPTTAPIEPATAPSAVPTTTSPPAAETPAPAVPATPTPAAPPPVNSTPAPVLPPPEGATPAPAPEGLSPAPPAPTATPEGTPSAPAVPAPAPEGAAPAPGGTPSAPEGAAPAPTVPAPAPEGAAPAPEGAAPAPEGAAPAPEGASPAPGGTPSAPEGAAPAPEGTMPAPPAPTPPPEGTTPAPAPGGIGVSPAPEGMEKQ